MIHSSIRPDGSPRRAPRGFRLRAYPVILLLAATQAGAQTMTDPNLTVTNIVPQGALAQPTTMAFVAPDQFLVLEKATGRVRRVLNGVLQPGFALDVHVVSNSERGLLGIAVAPGTPPRVFLYYTEAEGADGGPLLGNRVYRYDWDAGTNTLVNPQMIMDLPALLGPAHNAGVMKLDRTGLLYVMIGSLAPLPPNFGQLQNNPNGTPPNDTSVVFRVNQDGTPAAGNPFRPYCSTTTPTRCTQTSDCPAGETCLTQVARYYGYGLRNGFGLELDPMTGALWITENGPTTFDEVNRVEPGWNGGWQQIHGPDALDPQNISDLWMMPGGVAAYSDPEFSWQQVVVPTGIAFPYATTWGREYNGRFLVGTQGGNIYSFPLDTDRAALDVAALPPALQDLVATDTAEANLVRIGQGFAGITDIEVGPDDNVYVVDIALGRIWRISGPVPVTLQDFRVE
jgi:glucose/arabinose dehydrogenase